VIDMGHYATPRKRVARNGGMMRLGTGRACEDRSVEAVLGTNIAPQADGCWMWLLSTSDGYAQHRLVGRVHRWTYETLVGPIDEGHVLHHTCGQKACVNPAHLVQITPGEHNREHARLRGGVKIRRGPRLPKLW
jgi:hypothetical protein